MTASPRRWVTPNGARLDLVHLTATSQNGSATGLRDGGAWDGYCLTVTHPAHNIVLTTTYLGATVPETELAAALFAIDAYRVDGLARP